MSSIFLLNRNLIYPLTYLLYKPTPGKFRQVGFFPDTSKKMRQESPHHLSLFKINNDLECREEDGSEVGGSRTQFSLCLAGTPGQSSEEQRTANRNPAYMNFGGKKLQRTSKNLCTIVHNCCSIQLYILQSNPS